MIDERNAAFDGMTTVSGNQSTERKLATMTYLFIKD
jgi:hypothetical protein